MTIQCHQAIIRKQINAARQTIWEAFNNANAVSQWFSPDPGIEVEVLDFDFRNGGSFRICYHMPDGSKKGVGGTYDGISAPDELSFTWIWEKPDPHASLQTHVRV